MRTGQLASIPSGATVSFIALFSWILTAGLGLYLISIWLIEYDKELQSAAATRLPSPVLTLHVLMAAGGLVAWAAFMIFDKNQLAWLSVIALVLAALLGLTMVIRWIGVFRAKPASHLASADWLSAPVTAYGPAGQETGEEGAGFAGRLAADIGPPERNFPLPVVIAHGAFAVITLFLVLLTALRVFVS
jgi:hypothetical protein